MTSFILLLIRYRAIYDVIDMPWDWPVDINCHEAKAFCTWKGPGYRLPTEAEHHRMRGDEVSDNNQSKVLCDCCSYIGEEDHSYLNTLGMYI